MNRLLMPLLLLAAALLCQAQDEPKMTDAMKEEVTLAAIESRLNAKDYTSAESLAKAFLEKQPGFGKSPTTPLVLYNLGFAQEHQKKTDEALTSYARILSSHKSARQMSCAQMALCRMLPLLWARNHPADNTQPGDRQNAYQMGANHLKQTASLVDRMNDAELATWNELKQLVDQYAADPSIKTLEKPDQR